MPKISGANVAEHVAAQEKAVFEAAIRLFAGRGVRNVTTSDIANEVGLSRTSLYRYFPTKVSIVYRWFELVMAPLIEAGNNIAASAASRGEKFEQWVNLQLDFVADTRNQAMIQASFEAGDVPTETRAAIRERHQDVYASLHHILASEDPPDQAAQAKVLLIGGLFRSFVDLRNSDVPEALARRELLRAAAAIAGPDNTPRR